MLSPIRSGSLCSLDKSPTARSHRSAGIECVTLRMVSAARIVDKKRIVLALVFFCFLGSSTEGDGRAGYKNLAKGRGRMPPDAKGSSFPLMQ